MKKPIVGEYRLIPKGTEFWSIHNQSNIIINEDQIVEVKHTIAFNNDYVYVKPKQLIFNIPGYIPTIIGKGRDEWGVTYSKTIPYDVPQPQFFDYDYKGGI